MGDDDTAEARPLADLDERELVTYRESLQKRLAQAELPELSVPREEAAKAAKDSPCRASRTRAGGR
jgi:hypothetical protein